MLLVLSVWMLFLSFRESKGLTAKPKSSVGQGSHTRDHKADFHPLHPTIWVLAMKLDLRGEKKLTNRSSTDPALQSHF